MRLVFVRPVGSVVIPIPGTASVLAASGRTVDLEHPYWRERLAEGSIAEAPAADAATPIPVTRKTEG
jgi:hypothetical protein